MPTILIEIDTDTQAVVPMDLMRRIEDYLSTERVSAGVSLYNDVLGAMMAAAPQPEQAQQSDGCTKAEALRHILRVAESSRTQTKRLRWIVIRAQDGLDGGTRHKNIDLPKSAESSQEKLRTENIKLKMELSATTNPPPWQCKTPEDCIQDQSCKSIANCSKADPRPVPTELVRSDDPQLAHVANEWADMAVNGLQWLRNIRDGVSNVEVAIENMESNLKHCELVRDQSKAPRPIPTSERLPTEADADCTGKVWCYFEETGWRLIHLEFYSGSHRFSKFWQPTGLTRPAEPGGE